MKIGVVGPLWHNIPPRTYGGTEDVVANLVNGLAQKKHDVTLFGPQTAHVMAKVHPTLDIPLFEKHIGWENSGYTFMHIAEAFEQAHRFDILHVHLNKTQDHVALPFALYCKTPVLFTIHYQIPDSLEKRRHDRYLLLEKYAALPFSSISDSQRSGTNINFIRTIYNGIDLKRFRFSDKEGSYLVWLGKVIPSKGTKEAILVAKKVGMKLYLMGTIEKDAPGMLAYYEKEVKPLIDGKQVVWLGEVSYNEKTSILTGAKAFLNPIQWDEPFGLVMIESLAVGTPVIAYKRGSAGEIIRDGKTGFLVRSLEEMKDKITEVAHLDRRACRESIEANFTIKKMTEGYEGAYKIVIGNWQEYKQKQLKRLYK